MNAKKIMGAVLVALLAAALFVGAGAAADKGTVFINQEVSGIQPGTTWTNGDYVVTITAAGAVTSNNFVPGTYKNGEDTLTVLNPTATFTALGGLPGSEYSVGTYIVGIQGSKLLVNATVPATGTMNIDKLVITAPNGVPTVLSYTGNPYQDVTSVISALGEYTIQVVYLAGDFVDGTLYEDTVSTAYKFTVAKATAGITAAAETVTVGSAVKITITGEPGKQYFVTGLSDKVELVADANNNNNLYGAVEDANGNIVVTLKNSGKAEFFVKGLVKGSVTLQVREGAANADVEDKITIKVGAGTFTVTAENEAYIIGETIVLKGVYTGGLPVNAKIFVEGNNYDKYLYLDTNTQAPTGSTTVDVTTDGDNFEVEITTGSDVTNPSDLGKVDVGTYTFTIIVGEDEESVSVDLTQPFLTAEVKTAVVVQGSKLIIEGTAEATDKVGLYIFGNNMFWNATIDVDDENKFKFEKKIDDGVNDLKLATGQYFVVVQHKMYDKVFNVVPDYVSNNIYSNITGLDWGSNAGTLAVETSLRQNANGAEALCVELDKQNIDDIYVKGTFIVDIPKSVINPIPTEVTQGSKLTVSGSTNMGEGEYVKVQVISAAFGAVPKEDANAAAFITLTTKTDEDGNWEVTFDTSKLEVGEYTVVADVAGLNKDNANVNIIAGTPTEQPTTQPTTAPTQTEQPTETPVQTPGFGALAALAGLGAVAVLLLRRE